MKKELEQILIDNEFWSPNMNASTLTEAIMKLVESKVPKKQYTYPTQNQVPYENEENVGWNACRQAMLDKLGIKEK